MDALEYCQGHAEYLREQGEAMGYMLKAASKPKPVFSLSGTLIASKSGWILLNVPNAIGQGLFDALNEPGAELPLNDDGRYNCHVSVIRKDELESIGGPDKISERGHHFRFQTGELCEVEPEGWPENERCWFMLIDSPELEALRKSYGLSPLPDNGKKQFHLTIAVRKRGVLRHNDVTKVAPAELKVSSPEAETKAAWEIPGAKTDKTPFGMDAISRLLWQEMTPEKYRSSPMGIQGVKAAWQTLLEKASEVDDKLPGGLSDNKPNSNFDPKAIAKGKKIESEHTSDPKLQQEIAKDHLTENPKYYELLEKYVEPKAAWQTMLEKCAEEAPFDAAGQLWRDVQAPFGGPNPLTAAATSGAITGAAGYGTGYLIDKILPDKYFEKNRMRRLLGTLGAAAGAAPFAATGLAQYYEDPEEKGKTFGETRNVGFTTPFASWKKQAHDVDFLSPIIPADGFSRLLNQDDDPNPQATATAASWLAGAKAIRQREHVAPIDVALAAAAGGAKGFVGGLMLGRTLGFVAGLTPAGQDLVLRTGMLTGAITAAMDKIS